MVYYLATSMYLHASQNNSKKFTLKFSKNSCGEFIVSPLNYNKNNFTHVPVYKHHSNPQKRSQNFKNHTHTTP